MDNAIIKETINTTLKVNKISKNDYNALVADGTITEQMQKEEMWCGNGYLLDESHADDNYHHLTDDDRYQLENLTKESVRYVRGGILAHTHAEFPVSDFGVIISCAYGNDRLVCVTDQLKVLCCVAYESGLVVPASQWVLTTLEANQRYVWFDKGRFFLYSESGSIDYIKYSVDGQTWHTVPNLPEWTSRLDATGNRLYSMDMCVFNEHLAIFSTQSANNTKLLVACDDYNEWTLVDLGHETNRVLYRSDFKKFFIVHSLGFTGHTSMTSNGIDWEDGRNYFGGGFESSEAQDYANLPLGYVLYVGDTCIACALDSPTTQVLVSRYAGTWELLDIGMLNTSEEQLVHGTISSAHANLYNACVVFDTPDYWVSLFYDPGNFNIDLYPKASVPYYGVCASSPESIYQIEGYTNNDYSVIYCVPDPPRLYTSDWNYRILSDAVGARSDTWLPTPSEIGAAPTNHTHEQSTYPLTHTKSGTVHTLTGLPTVNGVYTGQFIATADYSEGDTFAGGYTAKPNGEEVALPDKAFVSGDVVTVAIDTAGKKLGFKLGGGVNKTLPPQIRNFAATAGNAKVNLSWQLPILTDDYAGLRIVRKAGSVPLTPSDGTKIELSNTATSYTDIGLTNGTTYYHRAFPYNAKGQFQTELSGVVVSAKPMDGILISALPVGATISVPVLTAHQTRFGNKVVFKVADKNHSGYPANSVTLITDKIIQMLCFDGKEPNNANSDRKSYGNNRYLHANLRQWLNSNAAAGAWYSAQHAADAPPNATNASSNAYDGIAGFLAIFDPKFAAALLETTLTVARNTVTDGGSYETVTDKVFLASNTEVGLANENSIAEGALLPLFSDNASRITQCTAAAITASNDGSKPANTSAAWYWWLRTPDSSNARYVRNVNSVGTLSNGNAYIGNWGVRPLCNLKSDTLLSHTPNPDGSYNLL